MEREPASDIITAGAGSPSPRIDATSFQQKKNATPKQTACSIRRDAESRTTRRARLTNTQKQSTRPMKRSELMMTPIAKKRPKPMSRTMPVVELKPKIKPKPRPRPRPTSEPTRSYLVIELTVDPHSSYRVMDLTGV